MLKFCPFFVHYHHHKPNKKAHKKGGFTAIVSPSFSDEHVDVQVTFCSSADQFCRNTGRFEASVKPAETLHKSKLNDFLVKARNKCQAPDPDFVGDYAYLIKYVK